MNMYWKSFRKKRLFLPAYFALSLIFVTLISFTLGHLTGFANPLNIDFFNLSYQGIILLPLGLILGVQVPALMHNCVHSNLRPKSLNYIAGELSGLYTLLGMAAFELNHRMHHVYSDTQKDPHNPNGKVFWKFIFANNFGGTEPVKNQYLKYHGNTKVNKLLFFTGVLFHFLNVPVRLYIWFQLLGADLFVSFFIPSYLFHMFVFAHINYYTHETDSEGKSIIYNLDTNLYYKFVNFVGSGVYYHANHHRNPNVYNPMKGPSKSLILR